MLLDGEFSRFRLVTVVPPMGPWIWASKLSGCVVVSSVEDLGLEVFCDASFSSDSLEGGVGVFVPSLKWQRAWKLAVVPSVFVAEMAAISQALLVGLESGAVRFTVLSDSLSAIRALQGHIQSLNFRHPTILEVGLRLFEAMQTGVRARVVWVRGHAGILGNEEADALSRAARCGEGGTLMHLAVSAGDLRPVVGDVVQAGWEEEWVSSPKGRGLYSLHPSTQLPRTLDKVRGSEASLLSRLRTGHILLNGWRFRMRLFHTAACGCGAVDESVHHFLLECPRFEAARRVLFRSVGAVDSLLDLLRVEPHAGPGCIRVLRAVVKFCRATGRFL